MSACLKSKRVPDSKQRQIFLHSAEPLHIHQTVHNTGSTTQETRDCQKKNMDSVFPALILCKIRYALCAWGGHITEAHKGQINAFLRRMHRYGYVSAMFNIDDMIMCC